ncbi:MAG TPA: hypothetical protein VFG83_18515 [Kofleriaceae bacterium]|nr:hypothetical protein [Kofleriaceae bacterium]
MRYQHARELARIRRQLRDCLVQGRGDGSSTRASSIAILAQLEKFIGDPSSASADLSGEYERWRHRFELLASG